MKIKTIKIVVDLFALIIAIMRGEISGLRFSRFSERQSARVEFKKNKNLLIV